jgi:hypothetical protein
MLPTEKREFVALLTDVLGYYRQPVSEFTLEVWCNACQPFTLEQIRYALTSHATDPERGQFAPKVADMVRILAGTHTERALLAWGKAMEAMSGVGAYTDVCFDDPAIHAVVQDLGGWPKLCRTSADELSYLQHRFCEAHKAYTGRKTFAYPRSLMGDRSSDAEYAKRGLPPPMPALIGNRDKARQVFEGGSSDGKTAITFQHVATLTDQRKAA